MKLKFPLSFNLYSFINPPYISSQLSHKHPLTFTPYSTLLLNMNFLTKEPFQLLPILVYKKVCYSKVTINLLVCFMFNFMSCTRSPLRRDRFDTQPFPIMNMPHNTWQNNSDKSTGCLSIIIMLFSQITYFTCITQFCKLLRGHSMY